MRIFLRPAITMMVLMTILNGLAFPLGMTIAAQALFPAEANGSLIERQGQVVGSALIGQGFVSPAYLHGRPSAVGYDAANSSGSNLGPTNADLVDAIHARAAAIAREDGVARPPADLVTTSASGLDPHLSPASALLQADRIARARAADPAAIRALIAAHVEGRWLGFIGEPVVNVLAVNLALDDAFPLPAALTEPKVPASDG